MSAELTDFTGFYSILRPKYSLTTTLNVANLKLDVEQCCDLDPVRRQLRSGYTMRTKCAISDAFVRDCVFA